MKFYKVLESLNNDFESELYHSVSIESTLIKIVIVVFMQMSIRTLISLMREALF